MTQYSMKQAADLAGRSKSTIHRDIRSGRISAARDDAGQLWIDASELLRVYPDADLSGRPKTVPEPANVALLEMEVEHLRALLERERQATAELSKRLDAEADERRRLTSMLLQSASPQPEATAPRPAWWPWSR